ncbi:MAG: hypothetical protein HN611_09965 [Gemmatimonadetes bacterium]|nr:hypothetical protein [Gemmatimonadota bacterium]
MSEVKRPFSEQPTGSVIPRLLLATMWSRIADRLRVGEVLITPEDFQGALAEEYAVLTGGELAGAARNYVHQVVEVVNAKYPETYVTQGIQNGVNKAFGEGVRALRWTEAKIQARGAESLRNFSRRGSVRELLDEVNVRIDQLNLLQIVKDSIEEIRHEGVSGPRVADIAGSFGRNLSLTSSDPPVQPAKEKSISLELFQDALGSVTSSDPPVQPAKEKPTSLEPVQDALNSELQEAISSGDVEADEVRQRSAQEEKKGGQLLAHEMRKIPQRLERLVEEGTLTKEEAGEFIIQPRLHDVHKQSPAGYTHATAVLPPFTNTRVRNSLAAGEAREEIESKVREAVEQSSRYLHTFDSMRKIDTRYDDALAFLIRYKQTVVADDLDPDEIAAVQRELADDAGLLKKVIDVMERQDHEIRMISVRLPPYNYIVKRGVEKIANMTIEESFLDELRHLDVDDISERMNSDVSEIRVKPAADMRCMVSLIDHVGKKTAFRKEIRMLRIGLTIQEFFDSTSDIQEARDQAEKFVNSRMRRLFPDMSPDETAEIRQRSAEIIDKIEQQVLDNSRAEEKEKRPRVSDVNKPKQQAPDSGDIELTDQEKKLGVQMGRVEIRVAGNLRKIPRKIMPDSDDPSKFVIGVRDPETGDIVPEKRRGSKRSVERGRDGVWRVF